jgi:hypothetical protein
MASGACIFPSIFSVDKILMSSVPLGVNGGTHEGIQGHGMKTWMIPGTQGYVML